MRRSRATPPVCPQSPIDRRSVPTFVGGLSVAGFTAPVPAIALPAPFDRPSPAKIDEIIKGMFELSPEDRDEFMRLLHAFHRKDYATVADIADAWGVPSLAAEYRMKIGAAC